MESISYPLIVSSVAASITFLCDRWISKKYLPFWRYLVIFLIWFAILIFPTKLLANDQTKEYKYARYESYVPNALIEINALDHLRYEILTPSQIKHFHDKIRHHQKDGDRAFKDAQNKCVFLPRKDREYIRTAFAAATSALFTGDPKNAVIAGLIATIAGYVYDVYYEIQEMLELLDEAKYHYTMVEWYTDLLNNPNA